MKVLETIGRATSRHANAIGDALAIFGETVVSAFVAIFRPRTFRFGDFALAFERAAFDGLPISTGIGFLLGLILAFESATILELFGLQSFIPNLLAVALFRELGPLVTAIVLAGRSGSAFAAEIGTMKVDEELDALKTMGLSPVRFLMLPRIIAAMLAMPILTIFAEFAGLIGGAIVMRAMDVPPNVYWGNVADSTSIFAINFGLAKGALFGLFVGFIGCSAGLRTRATADGVGVAATAAVVGGIVAIAVSDGLLAAICYWLGV